MSTYAELKARVAREMHRADLTSDIVTHMRLAIEHYAARRTWKNEGTSTITLTADTATKAIPSGLRSDDRVAVVYPIGGTTDYELEKTTRERMADLHGSGASTSGPPISYSWEDTVFKFWPIPDAAYVINVAGIFDDTALSADADTNSWTTVGESLIVARTKFTLARDVTYNAKMEAAAFRAERDARNKIFSETNERVATGRLRPGW
jgi:hypothetical protein